MAIEPVTREERFLAAAGGRSVTPPTPITRKEQLLQGIIDAVKSGGATPDVIEGAVNDYLNANPVKPGATTEQAAQIEQNKTDIADLQTEVDELKESGGNGSGQNPGQDGEDGATFTPAVSADGTLSWTNDKGLENPAPVNIKGPQGERGLTGAPGKDGYTPQKGVDYFDGQPGKGGKDGADGYTPVRGVDYYTEADKAEIVAMVIESLGGDPVFGYVDPDTMTIVFKNAPDGEYSLAYLKEDGTISAPIGSMVKDTNVYYTITNTLTNCTNSNSATKVVQGSAYSATITAKSGYALSSVKVTVGGTDISSTAVSGGVITISNVTGNIVITAVAEEIKADEPVTEAITITGKTSIVTDTGATRENTAGYCSTTHIDVSDIPKPCVIELTNAGWSYTDATKSGYTRFYIADTTGAKIASGYTHPSKMPDGVTMECGTETTNSDAMYTTATVTVTSDNIRTLRFAGYYSTVTPDGFDATVTKATLTYTPES